MHCVRRHNFLSLKRRKIFFMMIDNHTHIVNEKIYQEYQAKAKNKAERILAMPLPFQEEEMPSLLALAQTHKDLAPIFITNFEKPLEPQLARCEELFAAGKIFAVKIYPGYQHIYPSDSPVGQFATLCEKFNRPLVFHSGDFYDLRGDAILEYSQSIFVDKLAVEHRRCKIVISHFGFPDFLKTAAIVGKNENVYTDISGTIANLGSRKEMELLTKQYIEDLRRTFAYYPNVCRKTMFGTDYCGEGTLLSQYDLYIKTAQEVFPREVSDSVMGGLAKKLYFE